MTGRRTAEEQPARASDKEVAIDPSTETTDQGRTVAWRPVESAGASRDASTLRVGVVGARGAVGRELLELLPELGILAKNMRLFGSTRSAGQSLPYRQRADADFVDLAIAEATADGFGGLDLVFFSAGGAVSRALAPAAVEAGAIVIDNSSAFRGEAAVPLIVPEVNGDVLCGFQRPGIIANPNCTTAIILTAVNPIHRAADVKRMVASTYQAASGAGAAMMAELEQQAREFVEGRELTTEVAGRPYLFNLFCHESPVGEDGLNAEERKLVQESRRIWDAPDLAVSATCVRVPVLRTHCAAVNLTLARPLTAEDARSLLEAGPGVAVMDHREMGRFPEPRFATGRREVLVGRIRTDASQAEGRGLDLFIAGDQLLKGAAWNAAQIAGRLIGKGALAS